MTTPRERRQKRRRERKVPNTAQSTLPMQVEATAAPPMPAAPDRYVTRRTDLFVGDVPLKQYLLDAGMEWVVILTKLLSELDYSPFLVHSARVGRRPFHPSILLGLQIYGLLQGRKSLRELQQLASIDLAAWYVCGGHRPDHSTLGNFILDFKEVLTEAFFLSTTRHLVGRLKLKPGFSAIDGTVVESAASRFKIVRLEALREQTAQAEQEATQATEDVAKQKKAGQLRVALGAAEKRAVQRARQSQDPKRTCIVPEDADAYVQPRKDGPSRPSYKPSVHVHESGLIVGQAVDASSETAVLDTLLDQHAQVLGSKPELLAMDGGYHTIEVLRKCCEHEIDVLCPSKAASIEDASRRTAEDESTASESTASESAASEEVAQKKLRLPIYSKARFDYDEKTNTYVCPAGQRLHVRQRQTDQNDLPLTVYEGGAVCSTCERRPKCTRGKNGRVIKRYDGEELKTEMEEVLRHPVRRAQFARRKSTAEPPIGEMKGKQGATRFSRKGLEKVRAEWSLHCTAYNLRKAARRFRVQGGLGSSRTHQRQAGRWRRRSVDNAAYG